MFNILLQNILGYDSLIFLIGLVNVVIFVKIAKDIRLIDSFFNQTHYLQNQLIANKFNFNEQGKSTKELLGILDKFTEAKHRLDQLSVYYISITSIFPLLGILGTVIALLSLSDFTNDIVSVNFSLALTSTFWGIIFGAASKFGEGFFTAKIDRYDKLYSEVRANLLAVDGVGESHE